MHLSTDNVLEKCRICGGLVIERPSTGEIYCIGCYRDYGFLRKEKEKDGQS